MPDEVTPPSENATPGPAPVSAADTGAADASYQQYLKMRNQPRGTQITRGGDTTRITTILDAKPPSDKPEADAQNGPTTTQTAEAPTVKVSNTDASPGAKVSTSGKNVLSLEIDKEIPNVLDDDDFLDLLEELEDEQGGQALSFDSWKKALDKHGENQKQKAAVPSAPDQTAGAPTTGPGSPTAEGGGKSSPQQADTTAPENESPGPAGAELPASPESAEAPEKKEPAKPQQAGAQAQATPGNNNQAATDETAKPVGSGTPETNPEAAKEPQKKEGAGAGAPETPAEEPPAPSADAEEVAPSEGETPKEGKKNKPDVPGQEEDASKPEPEKDDKNKPAAEDENGEKKPETEGGGAEEPAPAPGEATDPDADAKVNPETTTPPLAGENAEDELNKSKAQDKKAAAEPETDLGKGDLGEGPVTPTETEGGSPPQVAQPEQQNVAANFSAKQMIANKFKRLRNEQSKKLMSFKGALFKGGWATTLIKRMPVIGAAIRSLEGVLKKSVKRAIKILEFIKRRLKTGEKTIAEVEGIVNYIKIISACFESVIGIPLGLLLLVFLPAALMLPPLAPTLFSKTARGIEEFIEHNINPALKKLKALHDGMQEQKQLDAKSAELNAQTAEQPGLQPPPQAANDDVETEQTTTQKAA